MPPTYNVKICNFSLHSGRLCFSKWKLNLCISVMPWTSYTVFQESNPYQTARNTVASPTHQAPDLQAVPQKSCENPGVTTHGNSCATSAWSLRRCQGRGQPGQGAAGQGTRCWAVLLSNSLENSVATPCTSCTWLSRSGRVERLGQQ